MIKNILSIVFVVFAIGSSYGQKLIVNVSPLLDPEEEDLTEEQFERIADASKEVMQKYYQYATFLDSNSKRVTQSSIDQFKEIFTDNAKLIDDLSPRLLDSRNFANYASRVQDFLLREGIKFSMFAATIRDVSYDEAGYYKVEVQTNKTLYNGLNFNNSILRCRTGRVYFLRFTLYIDETDLDDAKISKITGEIKRRCEDANASVGFNIGGGADVGLSSFGNIAAPSGVTYSGVPSSGQDEVENPFNVTTKTSMVFSGGFSFNYPITKQEKLFLSVNAQYAWYRLGSNITGTYSFDDTNQSENMVDATEPHTYTKNVTFNEASQSVNLHTVEIPVGVMYRQGLSGNDRLFFGTYATFVPTLVLSSSSTFKARGINYSANIDLEKTNRGLYFPHGSGLTEFGIGSANDVNNDQSFTSFVETNTALGVRLSPFVHLVMNEKENLLLEIALDIDYDFTDILVHGDSPVKFLPDDDDNLDIKDDELQSADIYKSFFNSSKLSTIGIRVGGIYKL